MLKIDKHRLVGEKVAFKATPNIGGALAPRYLVVHYTAGSSAASSIASLCTRKPQGNASAHLVIARDGTITQLARFDVVTWHAGVSQWNGVVGLNSASIGIEIDNAGPMNVVGHEDIARGRKQDPGPAFPLAAIASRALGRDSDAPVRYVVTADELNIRKGPDASFDKVAPALKRGAVVALLEAGDRWSKVEVEGPTDIEGWVNNSFMVRVADAPRGLVPRARPAAPRAREKVKQPTTRRRPAARQAAAARTAKLATSEKAKKAGKAAKGGASGRTRRSRVDRSR